MMNFPDRRTAEAFARPLKAQVREHKFRFYVVEASDTWPPGDFVEAVEAGKKAKPTTISQLAGKPIDSVNVTLEAIKNAAQALKKATVSATPWQAMPTPVGSGVTSVAEANKLMGLMQAPQPTWEPKKGVVVDKQVTFPWEQGTWDVLTDAEKLMAVTGMSNVKDAIVAATGKAVPVMGVLDHLHLNWQFGLDAGTNPSKGIVHTFKLTYTDIYGPF